MKFFTKDSLYVHSKDISFLLSLGRVLPREVERCIINDPFFIGNKHDGFDYYLFLEGDVIEFFKDIDWIIDYSDIENIDEEELLDRANEILEDIDKKERKVDKTRNERIEIDTLHYKYQSLVRDAFQTMKGLYTPEVCNLGIDIVGAKRCTQYRKTLKYIPHSEVSNESKN